MMPSFYCEQHPESPFNNSPRLGIAQQGRYVSQAGEALSFYSGGAVNKTLTLTQAEWPQAWHTYFGLVPPQGGAWPLTIRQEGPQHGNS